MHDTITTNTRRPNPWKWSTVIMAALIGAVLVVGAVAAYLGSDKQEATPQVTQTQKAEHTRVAAAPPQAAPPAAPVRPTSTDIAACNDYAAAPSNRTNEAVKHGVIGGAIGAGVGAATGAIADGGKGAGKGAGIGAIVGATAGTLYGLNKANQTNAQAEQAYCACMASRGY